MALTATGTNANNTLNGFHMDLNSSTLAADVATLRSNILWDGVYVNKAWTQIQKHIAYPGAFEMQGGQGLLYVPRRGVLIVLPGDWVAYDAQGWPVLISGWSATQSGGWASISGGTP